MSDTEHTVEEREQRMADIARVAEARAQGLVQQAKAATIEAESFLKELAGSPLMVNGMGKAAKEAHETATTQINRLEGLQQRIREHFNPTREES